MSPSGFKMSAKTLDTFLPKCQFSMKILGYVTGIHDLLYL
jgi:hypothetical protein